MRPSIFVAQGVPSEGIRLLEEFCDVEVFQYPRPPTKSELLDMIQTKDAILCQVTEKIDSDVMEVGRKLKVICSFAAGYENIDVSEATKRGIYVTNVPGAATDAVADLTWALILAVARHVVEADRFIRSGKWRYWLPTLFVGVELRGKVLGIIGLGKIGSAVAKRAKNFNMKVIYYDILRQSSKRERELQVEYRSLDKLLKEADFVSVHVPLTHQTYHLISEPQLKSMKTTAFLINMSRGSVVDQKALISSLQAGEIAGAALDVFEKEPIEPDSPLIVMDNVVLVPHIGGATKEARLLEADLATRNILAVLRGEYPPHLVNPQVVQIRPLEQVKMI